MSGSQFNTPESRVRGLGSAKEGSGHFIQQRVSAIALAFLVPWLLLSLMFNVGAGYDAASAWVARPWNALLLIFTFGAMTYHMRLGMQVITEDYMSGAWRYVLLMLNVFGAIAVFAAAGLSVLKIWFTAAM